MALRMNFLHTPGRWRRALRRASDLSHSRSHPLQILDLYDTGMAIADVIQNEHDVPLLEHLTFGSDKGPTQRVPPAVFRPQLRRLTMYGVRGPLPDNMGCMGNRTSIYHSEV